MGVTYDKARETGIENRGFVRGCNAMKKKLLDELTKANPGGVMRVVEIHGWIAKAELPPFEESIELKEPATPEAEDLSLREPSGKSKSTAAR